MVFDGGVYTATPSTQYIVNGYGDLDTLFLPYTSGTQAVATNFIAINGQDLNTIFQPF